MNWNTWIYLSLNFGFLFITNCWCEPQETNSQNESGGDGVLPSQNSPPVRPTRNLERNQGRRNNARKNENQGPPVLCTGFMDKNGIWNNGFQCPRWSNRDDDHCCGPHYQRYCCPRPSAVVTTIKTSSTTIETTTDIPIFDPGLITPTAENTTESIWSLPMIVSIATGGVVGIVLLLLICCFACACCPGRKWVKATQRSRSHTPPTPQPLLYERPMLHSSPSEASSCTKLACGCSIDGTKSCNGCSTGLPKDVDRIIRITNNPHPTLEYYDESPHASSHLLRKSEEPPPYCTFSQSSLSRSTCSQSTGSDYVKVKPVSSVQPLTDHRQRLSSGNEGLMATFKPQLHQSREVIVPKSPIDPVLTLASPYYNPLEHYSLQYPWQNRHSEGSDPSKRDSGVLEEEVSYGVDEYDDDDDEGNDTITVGQFNFKSPDILKNLVSPTVYNDPKLKKSGSYNFDSQRFKPRNDKIWMTKETQEPKSQTEKSNQPKSSYAVENSRKKTPEEMELEEISNILDAVQTEIGAQTASAISGYNPTEVA